MTVGPRFIQIRIVRPHFSQCVCCPASQTKTTRTTAATKTTSGVYLCVAQHCCDRICLFPFSCVFPEECMCMCMFMYTCACACTHMQDRMAHSQFVSSRVGPQGVRRACVRHARHVVALVFVSLCGRAASSLFASEAHGVTRRFAGVSRTPSPAELSSPQACRDTGTQPALTNWLRKPLASFPCVTMGPARGVVRQWDHPQRGLDTAGRLLQDFRPYLVSLFVDGDIF